MPERTPIGGTHKRDWGVLREQRQLSSLTAREDGYVRFDCRDCPRTGKIKLAALRDRFSPNAGLVNILNCLLPEDCPKAERDASGIVHCAFRYRDLS